jgi:hypothetical protein
VKWANSKYAWLLLHTETRLQPGRALRAQKGSEFQCEARSFANYVYAAAAYRGHKATVMVFDNLDHPVVVYAFYKANDLMRPNLPAYPIVKKMRKHGH